MWGLVYALFDESLWRYISAQYACMNIGWGILYNVRQTFRDIHKFIYSCNFRLAYFFRWFSAGLRQCLTQSLAPHCRPDHLFKSQESWSPMLLMFYLMRTTWMKEMRLFVMLCSKYLRASCAHLLRSHSTSVSCGTPNGAVWFSDRTRNHFLFCNIQEQQKHLPDVDWFKLSATAEQQRWSWDVKGKSFMMMDQI